MEVLFCKHSLCCVQINCAGKFPRLKSTFARWSFPNQSAVPIVPKQVHIGTYFSSLGNQYILKIKISYLVPGIVTATLLPELCTKHKDVIAEQTKNQQRASKRLRYEFSHPAKHGRSSLQACRQMVLYLLNIEVEALGQHNKNKRKICFFVEPGGTLVTAQLYPSPIPLAKACMTISAVLPDKAN